MGRQIVYPDPGLTYNAAISTGDPHFEMKKNMYIYIAAVQIVATLRIVMLYDTVLSLKNLVQFWENMNHK